MRTTSERIRHTLLFEFIGIITAAPIFVWVTEKPVATIGALTVAMSLLAMAWNYSYNLLFDHYEQKMNRRKTRSLATRAVHAIGFEGGFLVVSVPLVAWWLQIGLWNALLMDLGFMLFFLVYAFVFNWAYDQFFPLEGSNLSTAGI